MPSAIPKPFETPGIIPERSKYSLSGEELHFFMAETGIDDPDKLKEHMFAVQREAFKVHAYPCISRFCFTKHVFRQLSLSKLPGYDKFLELGRSRKDPIYLDTGCFFGVDVRKAIADGYPMESVVATDLAPEFWQLGHKLFNTSQETFPVPFLAGDAFDMGFLQIVEPFYTAPTTPAPDITSLTSLNPLRGHVSAVSICAVFHLFGTEEAQVRLARAIASLLSPKPGSMIIGYQASRPDEDAGATIEKTPGGGEMQMFYFSPKSWTELWDGVIFKRGTVKVATKLVSQVLESDGESFEFWFMEWGVTRL
ncbi:hypothetical protein BD309DRAFT_920319 [Dichomitus squalens]|uniref:Methyltransferase domain-containing protein n=2 Tax=Dichomitus squalens TaxID=114155 RepID=A0A4Q9Q2P8_9APHY